MFPFPCPMCQPISTPPHLTRGMTPLPYFQTGSQEASVTLANQVPACAKVPIIITTTTIIIILLVPGPTPPLSPGLELGARGGRKSCPFVVGQGT